MKWEEFKAEVDRQIKEKGIVDATIWYIDVDRLHGGEIIVSDEGGGDIVIS